MALKARKKKSTSIHSIRQALKQDNSPNWEGSEEWSDQEFKHKFYESMQYYNTMLDKKENKKLIIQWMNDNHFEPSLIKDFKKVKDWRCNSTMGGVISCLYKGMAVEKSHILGKPDINKWINETIFAILENSKDDISSDDDDETTIHKPKIDKNEEIINKFISEVDGIIDSMHKNDSINLNVESLFTEYNIKAVHTTIIKETYQSIMAELKSVIDKTYDDQIKEAYSQYPIKFIRKLYDIYEQIFLLCDKLVEDSIKIRKPRATKPISKEKLVAKLKYKQKDDKLGIKSVDPTSIIGAKELFLYDTKTRKLYRFISKDGGLSVKGTLIENYDESKSIGKTLLKPVEQLTQFKNSGKIALSKFIDELDTLDIKASGKITENQVLLKAV